MSVTEAIVKKIQLLSPEQQRDVLTFIERLEWTEGKEGPIREIASPRNRADAFRYWAQSHTPHDGEAIPNQALRREDLYD